MFSTTGEVSDVAKVVQEVKMVVHHQVRVCTEDQEELLRNNPVCGVYVCVCDVTMLNGTKITSLAHNAPSPPPTLHTHTRFTHIRTSV